MDLELVIGALAVAAVVAVVAALPGRGHRTFGLLVAAVAFFAWTAVLMWRHVLADGSDLLWAAGATVLAVLGVIAIVTDARKAIGARRERSTPAAGHDRPRDLAQR